MQGLNFLFEQIKKIAAFFEENGVNFGEALSDKIGELFEEPETKPNTDGYMGHEAGDVDLSDEDIEKYANWKEIKDLQEELVNSVTILLNTGVISEDLSVKINSLLSSGITKESINEIQELVNNEASAECAETETLTDSEKVQEYLDSLSVTARDNILEQTGGISEIVSITDYKNGTYKINTKNENSSVVVFPSGKYTMSYNDEKRTGFDTYDEEGKIISSTFIDHARNEAVIQENTTYNEDGSSVKTTTNSNEPNIKEIVDFSSENEITSIKTENTETGEITVNYSKDGECGSMEGASGSGSVDIEGSNSELEALEGEKAEVEEDLSNQQDSYDQTTSEKDAALSDIDSEISSGEGECQEAQDDLSDANDVCSEAQSEADSAAEDVAQKGECADSAQSDLEDAQSCTEEAQGCADSAQANNQACQQAENSARSDSNAANSDLADATSNTGAARSAQAATGADYAQAAEETVAAFNVRNQKQAKVDAAQAEYDNAKAKDADGDESLWAKIKSWVSNAWNALTNAIADRDKAQAEAEAKQREEEEAKVIDDAAKAELEKREAEQQDAQEIADAAQIVLERKTGEREVSDQEYADALLDLADAFMVQNNAESEYDSALTAFMEAQNYKADADGNLVDAQGNVVACSQIVEELELFVQGLYSNRENTEVSYNATLEATAAVISGDEEQLAQLEVEIETLKAHIEEEKEMLALQEQMLTSLAMDQGELDAAKDGAGLTDDIAAALWGGSYGEDAEKLAANKELLEKAIMSGNKEDVIAAYRAIYGDKEVYIDEEGNVITNTAGLTEEQLANYKTMSVSELSDEEMASYVDKEADSAIAAQNTISNVNSGAFVYNGEVVTMDDMNAALMAQANDMITQMENSIERQGWLSSGMSTFNDFLGFGTSESEAQAQVEYYKSMVEELENCHDPVQYAALYKELTGQDFDQNALCQLMAYNKVTGTKVEDKEQINVPEGTQQNDLTEAIDGYVNAVNEEGGGDASVLSVTNNSSANEKIQDYIQTQETVTDAAAGVITGLVTVAAVAAAPFTGGASIALAVGVGAAANVAVNASNGLYDKDGNGTIDFNYTAQEAVQDAVVGGISGLTGKAGNFVGNMVTAQLGKVAAQTVATTTFRQTAAAIGSRLVGAAVEGFIDGGASSGLNYAYTAATDENVDFSFETLAQVILEGGGAGAALNMGITGVSMGASGARNLLNGSNGSSDLIPYSEPDLGPAPDIDGKTPPLLDDPSAKGFDGADGPDATRTGATDGPDATRTGATTDGPDATRTGATDGPDATRTGATDGPDATRTGAADGQTGAGSAAGDAAPDYLKTNFDDSEARQAAQDFIDTINNSANPKREHRRIATLLHPDTSGAARNNIVGSYGEAILKYISFDSSTGKAVFSS